MGSKITADGDWSHEIKRCVLLGKKSHDQPRQHIKKQRHYFATKVCLVKAMVFPAVMYGCESWTVKKAYKKNHVAPPSSKDEALARYSVSREVPRSVLKSEKLLGTLDATPKVPRHTSLT